MLLVEKVFTKSGDIDKSRVHEVVLVGGSTRIPKVQQMLSEILNGKKSNRATEEALVCGAAVLSGVLSCQDGLSNILLLENTSHSLGIEIASGVMTTIIRKNTTLPTKRTDVFKLQKTNLSSVLIKIFEGEHELTKNCLMID